MSEPLQGSSKIAASDIALGLLLGIAFSCFYFSIAQDYRTFAGYTVYDNVLFGADHVDALEGWIGKHKGTHPLLPLIVVPLSNLFQSLCGSYELGLAAMSGCIGGLAVLLFYALTRMLVERIPSVLLATLFGVSMNQMVFSGLPDTYVLVAISVMPSFMLLIHDLRHSTVSRRLWIAAGVFAFAITITTVVQMMLRLAVALVSRYCIKRLALTSALRIGLTSLALGTLLVFLQHSLYPDSQLFYDLGVYEYEAESCTQTCWIMSSPVTKASSSCSTRLTTASFSSSSNASTLLQACTRETSDWSIRTPCSVRSSIHRSNGNRLRNCNMEAVSFSSTGTLPNHSHVLTDGTFADRRCLVL